jgi:pyrroloquinoline quinone (PQQ) biosynthesis protein C
VKRQYELSWRKLRDLAIIRHRQAHLAGALLGAGVASDANMVEEEGEDLFGGKYPSHRDLWVQFAEGLGIARDDILDYEPLPVIRAALEMYVSLVQQSYWAVAISTGLVFEGAGPERMKEEREAFEKYYPWISTASSVWTKNCRSKYAKP